MAIQQIFLSLIFQMCQKPLCILLWLKKTSQFYSIPILFPANFSPKSYTKSEATKCCCRGCHFYYVFTKRSYKKVLFLFTDSDIYEIVNKTQLQNISLIDITNAINQCFSTRATVRTCANEKNCWADDERGVDECGWKLYITSYLII